LEALSSIARLSKAVQDAETLDWIREQKKKEVRELTS